MNYFYIHIYILRVCCAFALVISTSLPSACFFPFGPEFEIPGKHAVISAVRMRQKICIYAYVSVYTSAYRLVCVFIATCRPTRPIVPKRAKGNVCRGRGFIFSAFSLSLSLSLLCFFRARRLFFCKRHFACRSPELAPACTMTSFFLLERESFPYRDAARRTVGNAIQRAWVSLFRVLFQRIISVCAGERLKSLLSE